MLLMRFVLPFHCLMGWYEAILHSRKPSDQGKYLVTFTTSGAVEEINSVNILLTG